MRTRINLLHLLAAVVAQMLTGCTSILVDVPKPAELSLGRGACVSIVPEQGSDSSALAQELIQLFSTQGYYQLVDRSTIRNTMEERKFQRMSFVENRGAGQIKGIDAFIYVQGEAQAAQSQDSNAYTLNGQTVRSYKTTTQVDYNAHYRAILMASSQIAGGRSIHLTDNRSAFSNEGYPAPPDPMPMVHSMRKSAANQIFVSLHPTVSKVRRYIGGSKSKFSKQAVNLANAGLWAEAVAAAEQGVQDKPKDEGGRFVLAIVYQGAGRYEDADRVLRELVGLSGKSKYAEALQENKSMAGDAARYRKQL